MMYGQAMYGSPFMYSPIAPQMSQMTYPAMQQSMMHQTTQFNNSLNPLGLTSSNYEEVRFTDITHHHDITILPKPLTITKSI